VNAGDTVIEFVGITIDKSTKGSNFNDFIQQAQRHVSRFSQKSVETIQVITHSWHDMCILLII
jgi:hypothetical protein